MKYKLSDVFELQMGKTPSRHNNDFWNEGTEEWISIADLSKCGKYINRTREHISQLAVEQSGIKVIPKNTLIMSFKLSIGKVAITARPMYSNEAIMAFIDKKIVKVESSYLYYLFMNKDWNAGTNKAVMGKTLNKATLSQISIHIHDYDKQLEIIRILDKVSDVIQIREKQLEEFDALIKSRFVEMFGDISRDEYKYETQKLGNVANVGSSHRVFTNEFVEKGVPFYRGTEIGELAVGQIPINPYYISEEHYLRLASDETKPQIGDLLMPSICNKGQIWMVDTSKPFYYKDGRVLCISADRKIYDTKYLQYYMRVKTEIEYPKLGSGSTFAEFKIFLLKDLDILTPPKAVQEQFATFVHQVDKLKFEV